MRKIELSYSLSGERRPAADQHLLRNPLLDVLHADFVVVNERLARHYGMEGVDGDEFRAMPLPEGTPRGGVLAQAGADVIARQPVKAVEAEARAALLPRYLHIHEKLRRNASSAAADAVVELLAAP